MVPLRLELKNFLAYRNPMPLDFNGLHVGVLVGENGAGKSSLLDAMTWVLWGRARAKRDEELVHQGQTEMRVELTFAIGGDVYRVIRARKIGRGAGSLLDLQARVDGRWSALGEPTIPKTQAKIERLLRLSYETFINSAYLVQGQADAFTGKKPADRKQVLADILGLQAWETYEDRAKQRVRAIDGQLAGIDAVLAEIETELAQRDAYARDLEIAEKRSEEVAEQLRQAEAEWSLIEAARQALGGLQRQIDDAMRQSRDAARELTALDADLREMQARADTAALAAEIDELERGLRALEAAEAERESLETRRRSVAEEVGALAGANQVAQAEAESLKRRMIELQSDAAAQARRVRDGARAEAERLRTRVAALAAAEAAQCPLCGQPLSEHQRGDLVAELERDALARLTAADVEATTLEQDAALKATSLETEVSARREQYRTNTARLKALRDDQSRYDREAAELQTRLREKPALAQRLAERRAALAEAAAAQDRIKALLDRRGRWAKARQDAEDRVRALETEGRAHRERLAGSDARQRALDTLRTEDARARAGVGAAEQRLRALEGRAAQREARKVERATLAERKGLFEELREAFGKRGAPALIIETAVPEIETEANRLLGKMTDGRMTVRINMQRETAAGDVRETLDIQIADPLGTRAYEMYSGGEAFRVNFAIRIALSQLLARRAGTQLHTLIVDEGFGVLDAVGRERLVEAINAVQTDFERILVVTHIEELKDAFPARIEITRSDEGSQITLA